MTLVPGASIGPYSVVEQVGRGGMATVYKAHQASLARFVAIKVLPSFFAEDEGFRERFQQEAIAVAKLRHPNILQVFDYGQEAGVSYIVTEFVEGGTLAEQIGTPLPLDYTVRILGPIAAALDYAHSRGILHRDVKPSNVLLARDGTPVLSDFGLAKMVGSLPRLTVSGATVGTPEYMAPEQGAGEELTPAADQYALAVVAYEMLTGRVPFTADTPLAVLIAHMHKPLPPPRSVNPALAPEVEQALLKGLAKDPGSRYQSAGAFVNALEDARRDIAPPPVVVAPPAAVAAPTAATAASSGRRRPPLAVAGGVLALLLLVAAAFALTRPGRPAARGEEQTAPPAAGATGPASATPGATTTAPGAATGGASPAASPGGQKGPLLWKATLDPSEYQSNTGPDPSAAAVRSQPGAIELAILKSQGNAGVFFQEATPDNYVLEYDLQFTGAIESSLQLRGGRARQHNLRLSGSRGTVQIEELTCSGGTCDSETLARGVPFPPLRSGAKFTLVIVAGPRGYIVLSDGQRLTGTEVQPTGEGAIAVQAFGTSAGTVRITGVRLYELRETGP